MPVYWLNEARNELRCVIEAEVIEADRPRLYEGLQGYLEEILQQVFPAQVVIGCNLYYGYRGFQGIAILHVEVQPDPTVPRIENCFQTPSSYIVKIAVEAKRNELQEELNAWDSVRPKDLHSDNILMGLSPFPSRESQSRPIALIYQNATTALGFRNVISLEEAVFRACNFGQPLPSSVYREIESVFTRLNQHFYRCSTSVQPSSYLSESARPNLANVLLNWREITPIGTPNPLQNITQTEAGASPFRQQQLQSIRRQVLALLTTSEPHYADPVDYLTGVWETRNNPDICRGPRVIRGASHGDLHARNVHVALIGNEVDHCAVFDYEKMRRTNFIAWDFIKLEMELAVRFLDASLERPWPNFVRQCHLFWRYVAERSVQFLETPQVLSRNFENPLNLRDLLPNRQALVTEIETLPRPVIRLAEGIVALRYLANRFLSQSDDWNREYHFLLAWYGLRSGFYPNYNERNIAVALVAAGTSIARISEARVIATRPDRAFGETTYVHRFMLARRLSRSQNRDEIEQGIAILEQLRAEYPHVLEIEEELILAYLEIERFAEAETLLGTVQQRYPQPSEETLSRWGRYWKQRGTKGDILDNRALQEALNRYQDAEQVSRGYFPAINVASILWLLGRRVLAEQKAQEVLDILDQTKIQNDPFWPIATRAEATLLLGRNMGEVERLYRHAVAQRECTARDRESMRRQLVLLRPHFDTDIQARLTDDLLNDIFNPKKG